MSEQKSGWTAVAAIGGLLGGLAAMATLVLALRNDDEERPAPEPAVVEAPVVPEAKAERPAPPPVRRAEPAPPPQDEPVRAAAPKAPLSGMWRGVYTCSDPFGDGRTAFEFTSEGGRPVSVVENFQRSVLNGTVVYDIVAVSDNGRAVTLSTPNYGGYEIDLAYDSTRDIVTGSYRRHPTCTTIRLTR